MSSDLNALTGFAVATYQRPGVAPACLLLQDRLGVDVTVLLHAMHIAASRGRFAGIDELEAADGRVAAWRAQVVQPLRTLRRHLKSVAPKSVVREKVKAAELEAELAAFALLCAHEEEPRASDSNGSGSTLIEAVARLYARHSGAEARLADAEVLAAIDCLAACLKPGPKE